MPEDYIEELRRMTSTGKLMPGREKRKKKKKRKSLSVIRTPSSSEAWKDLGEKMLRRGANVGGMGLAGSAFGPIGTGVGMMAGAVMPMSERPLTDVGALGAEAAAARFLPLSKGATMGARFFRGLGTAGAVGAGATVGQIGDRKADLVQQTSWGPVALYTGVSALPLALSALSRGKSLASKRVSELGEDIPLSFAEETGDLGKLEKFFGTGSPAEKLLGTQQNKAALRAFDKIITKGRASEEIVERGIKPSQAAAGTLRNWVKQVKAALPEGAANTRIKWEAFREQFNMSKDEFTAFVTWKNGLKRHPEQAIDLLIPAGRRESLKGLYTIRALSKVMPEEDFAEVGTALVMRTLTKRGALVKHPEYGQIINGQSFHKALFETLGEERLTLALGKERAQALKTLGEVMDMVDPLSKIGKEKISRREQVLSYAANKSTFLISGMGAGGGAAGAVSGDIATAGVGVVAGLTAAMGLSSVVAKIMLNPEWAKVLRVVAKGDPLAASRFLRAMMSEKVEREEEPVSSTKLGQERFGGLANFLRVR